LNTKRIVITGAPGTGKTSVVKALEASDFLCYPEIIRSMTSDAKQIGDPETFVSNPLLFVSDPLEFNTTLLEGRIAQFKDAEHQKVPYAFYDRAAPDVLAYMDFFKQQYDSNFENACAAHQYDQIFILPPWEAIYAADNERLETFEEATALHDFLMQTYTRFGYTPIVVPIGTVAERLTFILNTLKIS